MRENLAPFLLCCILYNAVIRYMEFIMTKNNSTQCVIKWTVSLARRRMVTSGWSKWCRKTGKTGFAISPVRTEFWTMEKRNGVGFSRRLLTTLGSSKANHKRLEWFTISRYSIRWMGSGERISLKPTSQYSNILSVKQLARTLNSYLCVFVCVSDRMLTHK